MRHQQLALWAGIAKWTPYRNKDYLLSAELMPCIRCWLHKGKFTQASTVAAHYTGPFQHLFGKGQGQKCDDHTAWFACHQCHKEADSPDVEWPEGDKSELQLVYIIMSQGIAFRKGVIG